MAEEYLLVKKTTYDRLTKQSQSERKEVKDQETNTEPIQQSQIEIQPDDPAEDHQTGSGLIYDRPKKRKFPPGMRKPIKKNKKTWIKF